MQPSNRWRRDDSRRKEPERDYGEFIDEYDSRTPPPPPQNRYVRPRRESQVPEDYANYRDRSDPRSSADSGEQKQALWDSFEAERQKNGYSHSYEASHPQLDPHFDRHFDYRYGSDDIDFDSREERAEPRRKHRRPSRRARRGY